MTTLTTGRPSPAMFGTRGGVLADDGDIRSAVAEAGAATALADATVAQIDADNALEIINGAATLDAGHAWLGRFVAWPGPHEHDLATVWALGTHCVDRNMVMVHAAYGRLIFTGIKDSGKTHAMERTLELCPRPDIVSNTTGPALASQIATEHPVVGLDEMDLIIGDGQAAKDLRNILNSGYKPSGAFRRAKVKLPVYAAVAASGLAKVLRGNPYLDTLRSRSFIIDMRPAEPGEIEKYRSRLHEGGAAAIAAAFASWGEANAGAVGDAWPEIPEGLGNRDEEIAAAVLAVAEVAGGDWPERIRAAVCALLLGESDEEPDVAPAERITADVRAVWTGTQVGTADLAARLAALPRSPWGAIFPDPARAGIELASYLRPYGISPVKIWLGEEGRAAQGYKIGQFEGIWETGFVRQSPSGNGEPEDDQASDLR